MDSAPTIVHLSDLHLGRRSVVHGDAEGAERLNSARQALARLASLAPDAILLAGDVFDSPHVDRAVVQEAARALDRLRTPEGKRIPVVVIPGNHDPADCQALWASFARALDPATAVRLVLTSQGLRVADDQLYLEAYPCPTRYSVEPPWACRIDVSEKPAGAFHVLLAHGTLQGGPVPEGETDAYPFTLADVEALGADYVALGHFHGIYPPWDGDEQIERAYCYAGTHEPDQFTGDSGYALVVTLSKGSLPRLRRVLVAKRRWRLLELRHASDLLRAQQLKSEVEGSDDPTRFVIRLRIPSTMRLPPEEASKLEEIEDSLRALGACVERRGELQVCVDAAGVDLSALPSGAVREALVSLRAELEQTTDPARRDVLACAVQLGCDASGLRSDP